MTNQKPDSNNIADKMYEPSDYEDSSSLSQALATTHEQVSDAYMAGTSDGIMFRDAAQSNIARRQSLTDETANQGRV